MNIVKNVEYRSQNNLFIVSVSTNDSVTEYQIDKNYIDNSKKMTYSPTEKDIVKLIGAALIDIWCSISYSYQSMSSDLCIELHIAENNERIAIFVAPIKDITGLEQIVNIKNWSGNYASK